jgi:formylglycine-generating enzyme required for sulfatase activity
MSAPPGTLLAWAAKPGTEATEGTGGQSFYTEALLAGLREPGTGADNLFRRVELQVTEATGGRQVPWVANALTTDFQFRPSPGVGVTTRPVASTSAGRPPAGRPTPWSAPPPGPGAVRNPQGFWETDLPLGPTRMRMVALPAGTFRMGTTITNVAWLQSARPVHTVTLSHAFWMGKHHVTQAQWEAVMGSNPSRFKGGELPVENVSWVACQEFLARLNALGQGTFRLPTEAEWEYACRAGTEGERYGDADDIAWYGGNSGKCTHPVGQKEPNGFGLNDMDGNAWQWCQDGFGAYPGDPVTDPQGASQSSVRVFRGSSWHCTLPYIGSTRRKVANPSYHSWDLGLRVVRSLR